MPFDPTKIPNIDPDTMGGTAGDVLGGKDGKSGLIEQLGAFWEQVQKAINELDANKPSSLLKYQFAFSQYQAVAQAISQTTMGFQTLNKEIVQNIR